MPLHTDNYFIELKYSTKSNKESFLDFTLDHLRINLCLPYVLELYKFAMEAINTPDKQTSSNTISKSSIEFSKKSSTVEEPIAEIENTENTSLEVRAHIKLPVIVLFSEPEKTNSKILLMKVSIFNLNFLFLIKNN